MARLGESPPSSEGVSLKDVSPETNITAYTPEETRGSNATFPRTPSKADPIGTKPFTHALSARATPVKPAVTTVGRSLTPGSVRSNFTIKGLNSLFDPFVDGSNACARFEESASAFENANDLRKLSATAKDFHPNQLLIQDSIPDIVSSTPLPKALQAKLAAGTPSKKTSSDWTHNVASGIALSPRRDGPPFSTDGEVRRYVFIGNINYASVAYAEVLLTKAGVYTDMVDRVSKIEQPSELYLIFDDLRAAQQSYTKAVSMEFGLTVRYLTALEFNSHCPQALDEFSLNLFAGQVHITARLSNTRTFARPPSTIRSACKELASHFGEVHTFVELASDLDYMEIRVEYFKLSDAKKFLSTYGKGVLHQAGSPMCRGWRYGLTWCLQDYFVVARRYMPSSAKKPVAEPMSRIDTDDSGIADMLGGLDLNKTPLVPAGPMATPQRVAPTHSHNQASYAWYLSPTGRTRIPHSVPAVPTTPAPSTYPQHGNFGRINGQQHSAVRHMGFPGVIGEPVQGISPDSGSWLSSGNRTGSSGNFGPRGPHHDTAGGQHNVVSIERIANGTDVRTTVMLRNIPNKMHLVDLKKFVDRSSYGKYDFIYLRIDFQNDCNVGYAFINFENSESIINFMLDINNTTWTEFHSKKIAEVSYATIQGKDCLIQKFRNSSVMKEFDGYRPKLFYTDSDPQRCGQEAPFPPPDNWSKVKRSIDNAQHIGLFPPRAGQQTRNEQRHRRSQFDRGTPRAQLEESFDRRNSFGPVMPFAYHQPTLAARTMFQY
ncbi:MAG: hypothetical protein M1821_009112 [Bathelium mastoideum]|nr:MAG: hypothetical protein M1821_009112 [Bathelium mastoideum]